MVRATHVNRSHRENSSIWKNDVTGHEVLGVVAVLCECMGGYSRSISA